MNRHYREGERNEHGNPAKEMEESESFERGENKAQRTEVEKLHAETKPKKCYYGNHGPT